MEEKEISAMEQKLRDSIARVTVMSEMTNRMGIANRMGQQTYGGARDVFQALGYPNELNYKDHYSPRYKRQDIAKAVIDRPVKASWKGTLIVAENSEEGDTAFEKAWKELDNKFKLKTILQRADKLTGLGRYSIILFGMSDCKKPEDYQKKVLPNAKLVWLKPASEATATIESYENDVLSERFGMPKFYNVTTVANPSATGTSSITQTIKVHYSRVLHLVEDILEDPIMGTPRLEAVFNRLIDLEKLIGGDAEMFWRGARPGYTGTVKENYNMTKEALEDLQKQIDEFEHNLRRILVNDGVDYDALAQQIADPKNHVDVQIQMISAVTGIPKRILVGSERGELSSAQDKQEWISYVAARREEQNEPMILRPFIDKCIELKVLPTPVTPYYIVWDKLFSLSDKEKVDVGKVRAEAVRAFTDNPTAMEFFPMRVFLEYILGMDDVQIEEVMQAQIEEHGEEVVMSEIAEDLAEEAVKIKEGGEEGGEEKPASKTPRERTVAPKTKK